MNVRDIVNEAANKTSLTKVEVQKAFDAIFESIVGSLQRGDELNLPTLGKFKIRHYPARAGRNPATGEAITLKASRKATFTSGKALKDALNGPA